MGKTAKKRGRKAHGKNKPTIKERPESEKHIKTYATPKRMQNAVDRYWHSCKVHTVHDLVLWLGFDDYEGFSRCNGYNDKFKGVIARAITRIKAEYEQRLADRISARGAEFGLKALGWGDRSIVKIESDPMMELMGKISDKRRARIPSEAEKKRIARLPASKVPSGIIKVAELVVRDRQAALQEVGGKDTDQAKAGGLTPVPSVEQRAEWDRKAAKAACKAVDKD